MREECFVLQAVRVSPANGRPVDDCFFAAHVFTKSELSPRLCQKLTAEKEGCFFDSNCCTKEVVVLRACAYSRTFSSVSTRCA